jgi:hypothetical protein
LGGLPSFPVGDDLRAFCPQALALRAVGGLPALRLCAVGLRAVGGLSALGLRAVSGLFPLG